jgi:hypothetical protein
MTERSAHLFGPLTLVSRRTVWPIISQTAGRSRRTHRAGGRGGPRGAAIGAQGLNMSLADIRTLLDLAEGASRRSRGKAAPAALRPRPARRYPRARHGDRRAEPGVDGGGAGAPGHADAGARRDLPRGAGAPGADADGARRAAADASEVPQEKVGGPHRGVGFAMRRALGHGVIHHPLDHERRDEGRAQDRHRARRPCPGKQGIARSSGTTRATGPRADRGRSAPAAPEPAAPSRRWPEAAGVEITSSGQSGSCSARSSRSDAKRGMIVRLRAARHHERRARTGRRRARSGVGRQGARGHHFQHARARNRKTARSVREATAARCAPSRPPRRGRTSREPLPPSSPARRDGQHAGLRPVGAQRAAASGHMARRGRIEGAVGLFDQPVQRVALGQAVDRDTGGVGLALHERQIHQRSLTPLWRNRHPMGPGRLSSDKTTFASTPPTPGNVMIRRRSTRSKSGRSRATTRSR